MMVSMPWQVIVAAIVANGIVIVALIMGIRDRADRDKQRDSEVLKVSRQAITEGLREGHEIYLELSRTQQNQMREQAK